LEPNDREENEMLATTGLSIEQARMIGAALGVDWALAPFDAEQFRRGLEVELEHGRRAGDLDVTHDDPILTGKIALAHLRELPDYYTRLAILEDEVVSASR